MVERGTHVLFGTRLGPYSTGESTLARQVLPERTNQFSRKDFTLPQLFACLVLREMLRLTLQRTFRLTIAA